jgi:hypothetical protein
MDAADSKPFSSAKVEVKKRSRQKVAWPAYELAFLDHDFLLHKSLRSVRLQLELLKPELSQQKLKIESTIVVFGSARVVDPEVTKQQLKQVQQKLKQYPTRIATRRTEKLLKNQLEKGKYYQEAQRFSQIVSERCQKSTSPFCHCHRRWSRYHGSSQPWCTGCQSKKYRFKYRVTPRANP